MRDPCVHEIGTDAFDLRDDVRFPVRAAVTTRTMQLLPIMTPSMVNPARSLFAQSA